MNDLSAANDPLGRGTPPRTVLVAMPFLSANRPSIQLGLLTAIAAKHGFPVSSLHANLDFAARIGVELYQALARHRGQLLGEWLFSLEAFGDAAPDPGSQRLDEIATGLDHLGMPAAELRERLLRVRHEEVPAYLDALVDGFPWHEPRVVGFTSTFQQNTASFALARRLKARYPRLVTIFGGANFDGEMGIELTRAIGCVDLAVTGEGDRALPAVLRAIADGTDPGAVPGVLRRVGDAVVGTPPDPPLANLDELPAPDYEEYFQRAERLGVLPRAGHRATWIPFESSRGCWWGEKHPCVFCGLNGPSIAFRAKSAGRVLDELAQQARRYRSFHFEAVDNIMHPSHLTELVGSLAASGTDYELFYEVKANLGREELRRLAAGGVHRIQPGLESLSSRVLGLMRKGTRACQNVNLLRWARYYGIDVAWNILWGFPGEAEPDYAEQAALVPRLAHLQPPGAAGRVWLERFSPLFNDAVGFPTRHRAPDRNYRYVYPSHVDLDRIAYVFEYEPRDRLPESAYEDLRTAVAGWSAAWLDEPKPTMTHWSSPGFVQIYDGRHPGREGTYTFRGVLADIYQACSDRPTTASALRARLHLDLAVPAIQEILDEFARRGLTLSDGSRALALSLPAISGR